MLRLNDPTGPGYLNPRYNALICRKHYKDLRDIIAKTKLIYPKIDPGSTFHSGDLIWKFSSGAIIQIAHFDNVDSCTTMVQGAEYCTIIMDEAMHWETDEVFLYLMSRLRNPFGMKGLFRLTSNPGKHVWLRDYFRIDDVGTSTDFVNEYKLEDGTIIKKRIKYIQAKLQDNPHLPKEYQATIMMMSPQDKAALLDGMWNAYSTIENQVYESELKQLIAENRFCTVRHDPSVSVCTYFDLGINDEMVILFVQHVGKEIRVINMMHGRNKGLEAHWIPEINRLASEQGYQYHKHYLPHDAKQRDKFDATSIEAKIKSKLGNVEVLQRSSLVDGIQSTRSMFPNIWIDKINCQDLLDGLQKYIRETDSAGNVKAVPIHSDIADAFRYISYASPKVGIKDITPGKSASPFTFTR